MKRSRALCGIAAAVLIGAGCATNPSFPAPASAAQAAATAPAPYLAPEVLAALAAATPASPVAGSPEEARDRAESRRYVALEDSDRWRLAQTQAELRPALGVQHFDCPLGTRLAEDPPDALVRLLSRALRDAAVASNLAKDRRFRARPIADDLERRACIRIDDDLRSSASHPSGHATVGALWGRIMADAAPDQAGALVRIGQEIGVSRTVCALHYPADVAAGQALGEAIYEALRDQPEYRADLAAARAEIAHARALGRLNPGCAAERAALMQVAPS